MKHARADYQRIQDPLANPALMAAYTALAQRLAPAGGGGRRAGDPRRRGGR